MPTDQELISQAEDAKIRGNETFSKSELDSAIQAYSQGVVLCDRLVAPADGLQIKMALLSNRAMCHLKQAFGSASLKSCIEDCTLALDIMKASTTSAEAKLRVKLLYRRAKALFLQANLPTFLSNAKETKDDVLQDAAKDLLALLSVDSSNAEANKLLQTIRAQHAVELKKNANSNTPVAKTLDAIKSHADDIDKLKHQLKVLMGLLSNDTALTSMELGRSGGVAVLLEDRADASAQSLALQCIACAASHPQFARGFLGEKDFQKTMADLATKFTAAAQENLEWDDCIVAVMAVYLRLILHLDRDDPEKDIEGKTNLDYDALLSLLVTALNTHRPKVVRVALDLLTTWTAGRNRDAIIRASLDDPQVDPSIPPVTNNEDIRRMTPQELSRHRQRLYQQTTRDQAWAFERSILFCRPNGGLDALLVAGLKSDEFGIRREITVALGKVLAAMDEDDRIKDTVRPYFGSKNEEPKPDKKDGKNEGVVIEELHDDYDEKEDEKVVEEVVEEVVKPVSHETRMHRSELASALLLARHEVGAWSLSASGWPTCREDLNALVQSDEKIAMSLVAEVLSAAGSVKETRPIVASLLDAGEMKTLVSHSDRDIRTAAASAVAKLGLSEMQTDDVEIMGLLEAACYMLEDRQDADSEKTDLVTAKMNSATTKSTATTSIERGVEVMTYLVSKTIVKEEVAHGFQATPDSKQSGLELLVQIADAPNSGELLTAFGLASIFQLMAVTIMTLRKESFEGKEVTMEQYDEIQKMSKTEEEKDMMDKNNENDDTPEQCAERIRKMANANVPRALVQLTEGASEQTLEQITLALNRMASEPSVRGSMIQQGVLTAVIKLDRDETKTNPSDTRKKILRISRHAMAKVLISTNPSLLTSAQRMGCIKPLIQLVRDIHAKDLEHFEGLMAVTNIAGAGEDTKSKIVAEKGIPSLHYAMFSDHPMVQRSATEAMCNLVPHEKMIAHLREPDTLRLWLALASDYEANFECARAAAGGLAMATQDPGIADTLLAIPNLKERIDTILSSGRLELMHRLLVIVLNLSELGGKYREAVVEHGIFAFCMAYVQSYHDGSKAQELDFSDQDQGQFQVTVDLSKQIVKVCEQTA